MAGCACNIAERSILQGNQLPRRQRGHDPAASTHAARLHEVVRVVVARLGHRARVLPKRACVHAACTAGMRPSCGHAVLLQPNTRAVVNTVVRVCMPALCAGATAWMRRTWARVARLSRLMGAVNLGLWPIGPWPNTPLPPGHWPCSTYRCKGSGGPGGAGMQDIRLPVCWRRQLWAQGGSTCTACTARMH